MPQSASLAARAAQWATAMVPPVEVLRTAAVVPSHRAWAEMRSRLAWAQMAVLPRVRCRAARHARYMNADLYEWPPDRCEDPTDQPTGDMTDCLKA